jgi:hypothetical protein
MLKGIKYTDYLTEPTAVQSDNVLYKFTLAIEYSQVVGRQTNFWSLVG